MSWTHCLGQFWIYNSPHLHIFVQWEEAEAPTQALGEFNIDFHLRIEHKTFLPCPFSQWAVKNQNKNLYKHSRHVHVDKPMPDTWHTHWHSQWHSQLCWLQSLQVYTTLIKKKYYILKLRLYQYKLWWMILNKICSKYHHLLLYIYYMYFITFKEGYHSYPNHLFKETLNIGTVEQLVCLSDTSRDRILIFIPVHFNLIYLCPLQFLKRINLSINHV